MASTYIILVNWNGYRDTIECLESLLRMEASDAAVIVVDNGSTDGSLAALQAWATAAEPDKPAGPPWPLLPAERRRAPDLRVVAADAECAMPGDAHITVVAAGRNLGFAGANNLGMKFAAQDNGARFFWLLNNDTVVAPDALTHLERRMNAQADLGILGACLLRYHQPDVVENVGGIFLPWRARGRSLGEGTRRDEMATLSDVESKLGTVNGASLFVRRSLVDRIGPMADDYFLYYEELDWVSRMRGHFALGVSLDAFVYHKGGVSIGTHDVRRPSDTSLYYIAINLLRYMSRHERLAFPFALQRNLKVALRHVRRRDWKGLGISWLALQDFFRRRYRTGAYGSEQFAAFRKPSSER